MTTTTEHLAGLLPALAERIPRGREPAANEAIANVAQILTPPSTCNIEVCRPEKDNTHTEVDRQGAQRGSRRPTLNRTAEPGPGSRLDCADEAPGKTRELTAKLIELLHRRVVAPRHVVEMFFSDVRHVL